jgi:addiction module HigA family antidote
MAKQTVIPPSTILKKLMEDYGLNPSNLAEAVKLNQATLRLILLGKGKISCPVALKLAKFFDKTPEYWLNLQNQYDISEAAKDKEFTAILKNIKKAKKAPPAKKEAKDAASKKKGAAQKDAPKAKKAGRPAADSRKTANAADSKVPAARKSAKAAGAKAPAVKNTAAGSKKAAKFAVDKAPAVKKPAGRKPAADKKAVEPAPTGARRGRKPKAAPAVPEPDPAFTSEFVPETEPVSVYQEEASSETFFPGFSFPETVDSGEE